jgi:hypothetical protein
MKWLFCILSSIFGFVPAYADIRNAHNLNPQQKQQIADAIKLLGQSKALLISPDNRMYFDRDILAVLEAEGRLEHGWAARSVVCAE